MTVHEPTVVQAASLPESSSKLAACTTSPEHRKNMLDPDLDDLGVGVAQSAKTGRYYAESCRPPELTFRLSGASGEGELFHPHNGSHYVIHADGRKYAVREE
jgi:hypothetical protein